MPSIESPSDSREERFPGGPQVVSPNTEGASSSVSTPHDQPGTKFSVARKVFDAVPKPFTIIPRVFGAGYVCNAVDSWIVDPALNIAKDTLTALDSNNSKKDEKKRRKSTKKGMKRSGSHDHIFGQTETQHELMRSIAEPDMEPEVGVIQELVLSGDDEKSQEELFSPRGVMIGVDATAVEEDPREKVKRQLLEEENYRPIFNRDFTSWEWPLPRQEQTDRLIFKLGFENQDLKEQKRLFHERAWVRSIDDIMADRTQSRNQALMDARYSTGSGARH